MKSYQNTLISTKRLTRVECETIAFQAIAWIVADAELTNRFLGLSGLDSDSLRAGLGEAWLNAAVLTFLSNHEADLTACAAALDIAPGHLMCAAHSLNIDWQP